VPDSGTRIQIAVVVAVMVLAVIGGVWYGGRDPDAVPVDLIAPVGEAEVSDVSEAPGLESVTVHVAGAVLRPGLVSVATPARIADAIAAAGGAAASADLGAMNLAAVVADGDRIHVPEKGDSPVPPGEETASGEVDLNRATVVELQALPGIGPVIAARIVAHRTDNGPFAAIEDLLDVPGIGESRLAELRAAVRIR
jgi:competence protein ComEA